MARTPRRLVRPLLPAWLFLLLLLNQAAANVEKTIFLGPDTINVPSQGPTFDDLRLDVLSPRRPLSLRTHLDADLPGKGAKAAWFLLDHLTPGKRYEVRVCWAATQPTSFVLDAYEVPVVWDTPELISSLAEYSSSLLEEAEAAAAPPPRGGREEQQASMLLLRVLAAADYYTDNETLMSSVPPVHVDLILDPFILNVLPQSLAPTVLYILAVAVLFWFVARRAAAWLPGLAAEPVQKPSKKYQ